MHKLSIQKSYLGFTLAFTEIINAITSNNNLLSQKSTNTDEQLENELEVSANATNLTNTATVEQTKKSYIPSNYLSDILPF